MQPRTFSIVPQRPLVATSALIARDLALAGINIRFDRPLDL
jgi:hypothetical protein